MESRGLVHVVADSEMERESLRRLLEAACFSVRTYVSAREFLDTRRAPVEGCLLLDLQMPEMSGLELQEHLCSERCETPIIFLAGHGDVRSAVQATRAGAFDYLEKPFVDEELIRRIGQAAALDRETRQVRKERSTVQKRLLSLSPREREVLRLLVAGKISKEIATELDISRKTVEKHRERIRGKMRAESLADLIRMALSATDE